jgi:D-tyrosyl-tRNA(Tyr) deacylase
MILFAVEVGEDGSDMDWLVQKIVNLRIFNDEAGVMNKSVLDVGGDVMVVSQFTLFAKTKKGNRPSYIDSAKPDTAIPIYERFVAEMSRALGYDIATGEFGADMKVELVNDGPVTIIIDTKRKDL